MQSPLSETALGRNLGESHSPMPANAMRVEEIILAMRVEENTKAFAVLDYQAW